MVPILAPVVAGIMSGITTVIERLVPDENGRARAKAEMEAVLVNHLSQMDLAQIAVNTEEAKHSSIFVSGWRPFIGWVCGAGLAYAFLFRPLFNFVAVLIDPTFQVPSLDIGELITLLLGMLGMSGYRTLERRWGVERDTLKVPRPKPEKLPAEY